MKARLMWLTLAAALLLLPAVAGAQESKPAAPTAPAQQAKAPAPTALTVAAGPGMEGRLLVQARLTGADGKPLGMQTVLFRLGTDFFGDRPVPLGEGETDSAGVAALQYMPSGNGEQKLIVRFTGTDTLAASTATATHVVTGLPTAPDAHVGEGSKLTPIWQLTGVAAVVATLGVWVILIGTVVWVRAGISR